MGDGSKAKRIFQDTGRRGGKSTLERYGKSHFSRIAKLSHEKRRAAKK